MKTKPLIFRAGLLNHRDTEAGRETEESETIYFATEVGRGRREVAEEARFTVRGSPFIVVRSVGFLWHPLLGASLAFRFSGFGFSGNGGAPLVGARDRDDLLTECTE